MEEITAIARIDSCPVVVLERSVVPSCSLWLLQVGSRVPGQGSCARRVRQPTSKIGSMYGCDEFTAKLAT